MLVLAYILFYDLIFCFNLHYQVLGNKSKLRGFEKINHVLIKLDDQLYYLFIYISMPKSNCACGYFELDFFLLK